jgi:repressor LexA
MEGELNMLTGSRIGALRKTRGISQKDLSSLLNVSKQVVSNWERGYTTTIPLDQVVVLAEIFDTSIDYILGRKENPLLDETHWAVIVDTIKPGEPLFSPPNLSGKLLVDRDYAGLSAKDEVFYFRVKDHSMEPRLIPGDLALIKRQNTVSEGETALVILDNQDVCLKRVYYMNKSVLLQSTNPAYEPIKVFAKKVQIIGKVLVRLG